MLLTVIASLILLTGVSAAQQVTDSDKHAFTELRAIAIDIDGDGKTDKIIPRTYSLRSARRGSKKEDKRGETHWIAFDLTRSKGGKSITIFRYRYGDQYADYWIWALKPVGDVSGDGRVDLVFYTGDDTSDETILLIQQGTGFKSSSTGIISGDYQIDGNFQIKTLSSYNVNERREIPERVIARWDPRTLCFVGTEMFWVRSQTELRSEPAPNARTIGTLHKHYVVMAVLDRDIIMTSGEWLKVRTDAGSGWVSRRALANSSCLANR